MNLPTPQRDDSPCEVVYDGAILPALPGDRLLDVILAAGIEHRHVCGGNGFCTSCRVEVVGEPGGLSPVSTLERERLGRDVGRLRLACQSVVLGRVQVRVPLPISSRFSPDGE